MRGPKLGTLGAPATRLLRARFFVPVRSVDPIVVPVALAGHGRGERRVPEDRDEQHASQRPHVRLARVVDLRMRKLVPIPLRPRLLVLRREDLRRHVPLGAHAAGADQLHLGSRGGAPVDAALALPARGADGGVVVRVGRADAGLPQGDLRHGGAPRVEGGLRKPLCDVGQAKVGEAQLSAAVHEDVLELDVPVRDPTGVAR
mmetsp:Transcript_8041/g.30174  ORF Transcript_8041/g.30174 Transcript_8041/m.30174 type:complete len:202 (-) Transcript_8041:915-1520(-)